MAALEQSEEEKAASRSQRVAALRAQWKIDKAAGKLRPLRPRSPPPPHPDPFAAEGSLPGVPEGCTGRFVVTSSSSSSSSSSSDDEATAQTPSMEERGDAIAAALERAASAASTPALKDVPVLSREEAVGDDAGGTFFSSFARRGRPVVVRGCLECGWTTAVWTPAALADAYDEAAAPWFCRRLCADGAADVLPSYANMTTVETSLREYLEDIAADEKGAGAASDEGRGSSEKGPSSLYGANNRLPATLLPHLSLPQFFPPQHTFRREHTRLWVGRSGAGTHCHRDIQDNFVMMVIGRKRFDLWPPHATHTGPIGGARPVTPFLHEAAREEAGLNYSSMPPLLGKDEGKESSQEGEGGAKERGVEGSAGGVLLEGGEEEAGKLSVILEPGDCLFLPAGWWHATETLCDGDGGFIGASVNFFCAATYSALGVVPPDIFPADWPLGFEPKNYSRR